MKIWFQNRRTKWKKHENITATEIPEHKLQAVKNPDVAKAIQNAAKLRKAKERLEVSTSNNSNKKENSYNQPLDFSMESLAKLKESVQDVSEKVNNQFNKLDGDILIKTENIGEQKHMNSDEFINHSKDETANDDHLSRDSEQLMERTPSGESYENSDTGSEKIKFDPTIVEPNKANTEEHEIECKDMSDNNEISCSLNCDETS